MIILFLFHYFPNFLFYITYSYNLIFTVSFEISFTYLNILNLPGANSGIILCANNYRSWRRNS